MFNLRALFFLPFLLYFLTTAVSQGRVGETLEQCMIRYGNPLSFDGTVAPGMAGDKEYNFLKNGYSISIIFIKGIASVEFFSKTNDEHDFSLGEIETILDAEASSYKWTKTAAQNAACTQWQRDDGQLALYDPSLKCLSIASEDYVIAQKIKKASDTISNLKDF